MLYKLTALSKVRIAAMNSLIQHSKKRKEAQIYESIKRISKAKRVRD